MSEYQYYEFLAIDRPFTEKQKRDRKRQEIRRFEKRKAYLKNLSKDFPKAWESVGQGAKRPMPFVGK